MALQGKHSRTAGNVPNLIPGEFGVNLADFVLWLRGKGTKIPLDLNAVIARAAPAAGPTGAPIRYVDGAYIFDQRVSPSSVVAGVVDVDPSPIGGLGVPGVYLSQTTLSQALDTNDVLVESFYVASDALPIKGLSINAATTPSGAMRLGILGADGTMYADYLLSDVVIGSNGHNPDVPVSLPRGAYYLMAWTAAPITLTGVLGFHPDQGWDYDGSNNPIFTNGGRANADYVDGLVLPTITPVTSSAPGESRRIFALW